MVLWITVLISPSLPVRTHNGPHSHSIAWTMGSATEKLARQLFSCLWENLRKNNNHEITKTEQTPLGVQ